MSDETNPKNKSKNRKKIKVFTKKKKGNEPETVFIKKLTEKYKEVSQSLPIQHFSSI